ncbi:hypothetical protein [Bacillus cereus group sp. BceL008]|uniref:hypothetical protein n=1 Tax=Bacillus cereus group sp. BceL008 TaxID=3445220 RepID=UPI003F29B8EA
MQRRYIVGTETNIVLKSWFVADLGIDYIPYCNKHCFEQSLAFRSENSFDFTVIDIVLKWADNEGKRAAKNDFTVIVAVLKSNFL